MAISLSGVLSTTFSALLPKAINCECRVAAVNARWDQLLLLSFAKVESEGNVEANNVAYKEKSTWFFVVLLFSFFFGFSSSCSWPF
jgi:hypothetical protein